LLLLFAASLCCAKIIPGDIPIGIELSGLGKIRF